VESSLRILRLVRIAGRLLRRSARRLNQSSRTISTALLLGAVFFSPAAFPAWGNTQMQYYTPTLNGVSTTYYSGEWYIPYPVNCEAEDFGILVCEYWEYSQVGVTAFLYSPFGYEEYYDATDYFTAEASIWRNPSVGGIWYQNAWHYVLWDVYQIGCQNSFNLGSCQMGWYLRQDQTYDDSSTESVYVDLEPPGPPECPSPYSELTSQFATRSAAIQAQYGMTSFGNTFNFGLVARLDDPTPLEQSEFSLGANEWTKFTTSICGSFNSVASIQTTTSIDADIDVLYLDTITNPDNPNRCGSNRWAGDGGIARDEIRLRRTGIQSHCDNHRVETVYHEIGHSLGFVHQVVNPPLSMLESDLYHDPRPFGAGPRVIEAHHLRILVEKY
jgi:hypothetical protein